MGRILKMDSTECGYPERKNLSGRLNLVDNHSAYRESFSKFPGALLYFWQSPTYFIIRKQIGKVKWMMWYAYFCGFQSLQATKHSSWVALSWAAQYSSRSVLEGGWPFNLLLKVKANMCQLVEIVTTVPALDLDLEVGICSCFQRLPWT